MGNNQKKNKLYCLFEEQYKINMFYKPSMADDDIFYYVILDNVVRLTLRVFSDSVITIHEVTPLTDAYLVKFYKKLIEFFHNQTQYTVLISRIGNTMWAEESCIELKLPTVDDTRFISVPIRLYERYKKIYGSDTSKYGITIVTVAENFNEIKEEKREYKPVKKPVEIIEEPKKPVPEPKKNDNYIPCDIEVLENFRKHLLLHRDVKTVDNIHDNIYSATLNDIEVHFYGEGNTIYIDEVLNPNHVSTVFYVDTFEYIEAFLHTGVEIIFAEVNDITVYNLCKLREYEKLFTSKSSRNNFGTYKARKLR